MKYRHFIALGVVGALTACANSQSSNVDPAVVAANMQEHMAYLASDELEGREPGTPGYDAAANYVAEQFAEIGLAPGADDGGYFQPVTLRNFQAAEDGRSLEIASAPALVAGQDYVVGASAQRTQSSVQAPVVFVGYGIVAEEAGINDYEGMDVEGKIIAALYGAPDDLDSELQAHLGSTSVKAQEAEKRGAIGAVWLYTPAFSQRFGFERMAAYANRASMTWVSPDGQANSAAPDIRVSAVMSIEGARKLFSKADVSYDEVLEAAVDPDGEIPRFDMPVLLSMSQASEHEDIESVNVVGVLPGSDPDLRDETVVLTAHLDHIGVSQSGIDGDYINNGAMDNAAGTSAMIEAARMAMAGPRLPRSTMFLALTAEERGLLGSEYFVAHPTESANTIVANVNLDMPVLLYDFTDVTAFGAERSTLGPLVEQAAGSVDVALSPDPMPEQNLFTRSDHYSFVKGGIPSVFLVTGFDNGGEEIFRDFLGTYYHRPNDDMDLDINFDAGAKFARVNYEILRSVSNAPERPKWRAGDYFGNLYGGPMEEAE